MVKRWYCIYFLVQVITSAEFHPRHCNIFAYSSSKGCIRLADMRNAALCDQHAKAFEETESQVSWNASGASNDLRVVKTGCTGSMMVCSGGSVLELCAPEKAKYVCFFPTSVCMQRVKAEDEISRPQVHIPTK